MSALRALHGKLRFGIQAPQQHTSFPAYASLWERAEQLGLEWASVCDHFVPTQGDTSGPCLEGPTLLAALAARTRRLRCGILVVGVTYRHPAMLANVAATIDHVSGGRLELGLGAGWHEPEHRQYGIPFPSLGERSQRLRETAHVLRRLWTEDRATYEGDYYRLADARCEPKPLQRPHVPLWIGGTGERVVLRTVAECADGWNTFLLPEDEYRHKLDVLTHHCRDLGRDPSDIRRAIVFHAVLADSVATAEERLRERASALRSSAGALRAGGMRAMTVEDCADELGRYARLGVADFVLYMRAPVDEQTLELLAREVAPRVGAAAH